MTDATIRPNRQHQLMQQEVLHLREQLAKADVAFSELQSQQRQEQAAWRARDSQMVSESAALRDAKKRLEAENLQLRHQLQIVFAAQEEQQLRNTTRCVVHVAVQEAKYWDVVMSFLQPLADKWLIRFEAASGTQPVGFLMYAYVEPTPRTLNIPDQYLTMSASTGECLSLAVLLALGCLLRQTPREATLPCGITSRRGPQNVTHHASADHSLVLVIKRGSAEADRKGSIPQPGCPSTLRSGVHLQTSQDRQLLQMLLTSKNIMEGPYKLVQDSPTNASNFVVLERLLQRAFGDQVGLFWPPYIMSADWQQVLLSLQMQLARFRTQAHAASALRGPVPPSNRHSSGNT